MNRLPITIFDLDLTLIRVNSSIYFYNFLRKQSVFNHSSSLRAIIYWLQYRLFNLSAKDLHEKIFKRFLLGKNENLLLTYVKKFWDQYFDLLSNKKIVQCIHEAKKKGNYLLLFSSSPQFLISYLANILPFDRIYGSKYGVDETGRFQNVLSVVDGQEKRRLAQKIAIEQELQKEGIIAYSDSYRDLPLLELASKTYLVNPDRRLKRVAKKKNWIVL